MTVFAWNLTAFLLEIGCTVLTAENAMGGCSAALRQPNKIGRTASFFRLPQRCRAAPIAFFAFFTYCNFSLMKDES